MVKFLKNFDEPYRQAACFIIGVTCGIIGALPLFGFSEPFKGMEGIKNFIILLLAVALLIVATWFIIFYYRAINNNNSIKKARKLLTNKKYEDVLTLIEANDLSRSLWIEGKLDDRITLGKIAERAAMNLKRDVVLASIYIDDLGWTYVSRKEYDEAIRCIEKGKEIADNEMNYYLVAKAHRHLAGIAIETRKYDVAEARLKDAESAASGLFDETKKNEMLSGIFYGKALNLLKECRTRNSNDMLIKAMKYAEKSDELIKNGDKTRMVKNYALKGNIYEAKNDRSKAKNEYTDGLDMSKRLGRVDEIIKNHLGLARIAKLENDTKTCKKHEKSAKKLLNKTPPPYLIDEKEMELIRI